MQYNYDLKTRIAINNIIGQLAKTYKGQLIDMSYIENYKTCPNCKNDFKVYRNEIQGVGVFSIFLKENTAIGYCLCKKCASNEYKIKHTEIENYLIEKIDILNIEN